MDENGLKQHLIKIYKKHDFELKGNTEKVVDATMDEISDMINKMMDDMYKKIKRI